MGWRETIFDPWKVPTYIAGIAIAALTVLGMRASWNECGTLCQLDRIQTTLDRIEKKLDDTTRRMQIGKCDLNDPLGTRPLQQKASFQ